MSDKDSAASDGECDKKGDENLPPTEDRNMSKYADRVRSDGSKEIMGKLKEESKDDIKNFAEDTMNELLGWYGYEKPADGAVDRKLLKRGSSYLDKHRLLHAHQPKYDMDCSNESNDSSITGEGILKESETTSRLSYKNAHQSDTEQMTECSERSFVVCTWCEKGRTLDKHYVMSTGEGDRKFCSEQCFDHSRRDKYKKHKMCEWCKNPCTGTKSVEFEDGEDTFLFCSENCLNKYKMNIFCQETQEHMKKVQTETPSVSSAPKSTSASRILITPELWTEETIKESQAAWSRDERNTENISRKMHSIMRPMPLQERPRQKNKMASSHVTNMTPDGDSILRVVALKAKAELEHPKTSRPSNNTRPPRMTDREKIKQIRMRDRLPLHTPLRETYRNQSATDGPFPVSANLTGSDQSPISSSCSFNTHALLNQTQPISSTLSQMSPMSATQLFGAFAASQGIRAPISSHSVSPKLERGSGKDNSDCSSSQSMSPRLSSSEIGANDSTPAPPPLYPPPNPFTHALPSFFNPPGGPLGFPAAPGLASLSALSALYPPPFMPSAMHNLMPPNTLMVPYPFPLPLPIPIPIPIPIPQKLIESLGKEKAPKAEASNATLNDKKDNVFTTDCKNGCNNDSRSQQGTSDRLPCSCCNTTKVLKEETSQRHSVSPNSIHRYFLDSAKRTSDPINDGAIDLSTDSTRYRPRSLSPARVTTTPNHHPNPVIIQPTSDTGSDLSPGPPVSPFTVNSLVSCTSARYSSRRNLILDAPAAAAAAGMSEHARSPSPAEKRTYNGPSVRDILYGKRKCSRPRIKTK